MAVGATAFGDVLKAHFDATLGAYSEVTVTEAGDGQVTLTGSEKEIVVSFFGGADLAQYRGSADSLEQHGLDARRSFRHFPTGEIVRPKVLYPKAEGNELRLYFSNEAFKVSAGDFWGVFLRENDIWLCSFSGRILKGLGSGDFQAIGRDNVLEPEEDDFQEVINGAPPGQVQSVQKRWLRDPSVSQKALISRGFACELFPQVPTFISKRSGEPFQEAHHLIPMREQNGFPSSLDTVDNVCVLSPFGHRMIHHAPFELIVPHIRRLVASRGALLERHGLLEDDLLSFYR